MRLIIFICVVFYSANCEQNSTESGIITPPPIVLPESDNDFVNEEELLCSVGQQTKRKYFRISFPAGLVKPTKRAWRHLLINSDCNNNNISLLDDEINSHLHFIGSLEQAIENNLDSSERELSYFIKKIHDLDVKDFFSSNKSIAEKKLLIRNNCFESRSHLLDELQFLQRVIISEKTHLAYLYRERYSMGLGLDYASSVIGKNSEFVVLVDPEPEDRHRQKRDVASSFRVTKIETFAEMIKKINENKCKTGNILLFLIKSEATKETVLMKMAHFNSTYKSYRSQFLTWHTSKYYSNEIATLDNLFEKLLTLINASSLYSAAVRVFDKITNKIFDQMDSDMIWYYDPVLSLKNLTYYAIEGRLNFN